MSAPSLTTTYPNWLSSKAIAHMNGILRDVQREAGITEPVRLQYLTEQDVLKRELPANSLLYVPSSTYSAPYRICVIVTGKDPRNEKARVTLSMTVASAEKMRVFLLSQPQTLYSAKVERPAIAQAFIPQANGEPCAPHIQALDLVSTSAAEDRAIFLTDVRSHGCEITRATAAACTGGHDSELIKDCVSRGSLSGAGSILTLTPAGKSFLKTCFDAPAEQPAEEVPVLSDFDRLKGNVQQARAHYAAVQEEHGKHATARTLLTKELATARKDHADAENTLKNLQERIATVQARIKTERGRVLQLESEQKALPDEARLHASQRELEAAEKAYKEFIAI